MLRMLLGRKKRKESEDAEGKRKKSRLNGSDRLMYLRENNNAMKNLNGEEMDLKKRELDLQAKRHDGIMRALVQQQAKATQDFQTMVLAILSKMGQK